MGRNHQEVTLRPRPLELLVYVGQDVRAYPVPPDGELSLGRASSNDIRVEHRSVSRNHLRFYIDGTVYIEDLGSSNGTYLVEQDKIVSLDERTKGGRDRHDRRLPPGERRELSVGSVFRIGSVMLVLQSRKHSVGVESLDTADSKLRGPAVLLDPQMVSVYGLAARAAASDISVLILGETGSGKEILAESIHFRSPRAAGPFLRLNCAALSESLLESELFGYERGAFTGATQTRIGLLESSSGGTVFLDEVGELPLSIQVKLLRVLEERIVRRVGANRGRHVDVRFITATNRELKKEVHVGNFRKDLYFRINGVLLTVPPLRDRVSEIEPLARHFLQTFCQRSKMPVPELTSEAIEAMLHYDWPGNVRELRNAMERAPFLSAGGPLLPEHMPAGSAFPDEDVLSTEDEFASNTAIFSAPAGFEHIQPSPLESSERDRILGALETCGGNQTRAAQLLGISRRTLINRLDEYGLPRPRKR